MNHSIFANIYKYMLLMLLCSMIDNRANRSPAIIANNISVKPKLSQYILFGHIATK